MPGDLDDVAALERLCDGADVVIHAAGLVKARTTTEMRRVNVEGSRRLADAARAAPHVIHISSLTAREPALSPYANSKRDAETAMRETLAERLSILRPCAIYGPGDRELLPVFRAARRMPVLPILNARGRIAMIHVDDAAALIAKAAGSPPLAAIATLCDDQPQGYGWRELMSAAASAVGRNPRLAPTPRPLVQAVGVIGDLSRILGANPMLTSAKSRELLHEDWSVTHDERGSLNGPVRHTLATGFADTVAAYERMRIL